MWRIIGFLPILIMWALFADLQSGDAQNNNCPALVQRALESIREVCGDLGRNSVCYGSNRVEASFDSTAQVTFNQPSDKASIDQLRTLRTFPLDEHLGLWGVARMNIQANLPNTLPGQGVKFVLYGDAAIESRSESQTGGNTVFGPMQAFYFTTGAGDVKCNQLPPSSLVIQSPKGVSVHLNVNGLDVSVGSTVALTAQKGDAMRFATLDGKVVTRRGTQLQVIPAGFESRIELGGDDDLTPIGDVEEPQPLDEAVWDAVVEGADDVLGEPIDMPDSSSFGDWDEFCADPDNAEACSLPDDLCAGGWCEPVCGDLTCDVDEDSETCAVDCASDNFEDEPFCGDLTCDVDEDSETCAVDCASDTIEDEPFCGDLICDIGEDAVTCAEDCAGDIEEGSGFEAVCGDLICDVGEDANTCALDCAESGGSDDSGSDGGADDSEGS